MLSSQAKPYTLWYTDLQLRTKQHRSFHCGARRWMMSPQHQGCGLDPGSVQWVRSQYCYSCGVDHNSSSDSIPGLGTPYAMWQPKKKEQTLLHLGSQILFFIFLYLSYGSIQVDLQCCISAVWQSDSITHIYALFYNLFHYGLLQDTEDSSLCYTYSRTLLFIWAHKFYKRKSHF